MKSSHTPTKHAIPFGQNGNKRDIPQETKTGSGEASLSLGFPPETMVPKVSGGIPPSGKDFNGILNELSAMGRWANAGAGYPFDAAFANAIGGYPAGAKIPNSENNGFWLNTVDNNLDNPEVADDRLTGWIPAENYGIATLSGLAKADVTLTALQAAKARIVLTGDLKANVAVIFPAWQKSWTVVNQCTGSGSLICRTKAGTGVVVPNGESREIVGDGSGLVQRIVNASTTVSGIAQLSSATDSDSETLAATPKAVKSVVQLANDKLAKDQNGEDIPDKEVFLKNLGLGDIALAGVCEGLFSGNGYISIPAIINDVKQTLYIQWGSAGTNASGKVTVTFPTAFKTAALRGLVTNDANSTPAAFGGIGALTKTTATITSAKPSGEASGSGVAYNYLVIGY